MHAISREGVSSIPPRATSGISRRAISRRASAREVSDQVGERGDGGSPPMRGSPPNLRHPITPTRQGQPLRLPQPTYNRMDVEQPTDAEVHRLFRALADAARRDPVVRAAMGNSPISVTARCYSMSVTAAFATVHDVLHRLEAMWRNRLDRLGDILSSSRKEIRHDRDRRDEGSRALLDDRRG